MASGDIQETAINIDHTHKLVEVYTNRRSVFLAWMKRCATAEVISNDDYGWAIRVPWSAVRSSENLAKPDPRDPEAFEALLTESERERRAATAERRRGKAPGS